MSAFNPGLLLCDRFEVVRRLGAGGLAEVFQARDRVSGQEVALKVLHDHLMQDGSLAERFRREMALTRSLDHPAIVRVFDLHEHGGRPFFSMELLRGRTLSARLQEGPLPADEARRIALHHLRGAAGGAQGGHRPSRPEAAECLSHRRLRGEAARLRHGAGGGTGPDDGAKHGDGNARLHRAGAALGRGGRRPSRRLLAGSDALRDAHRPPRLRRQRSL